MRSARMLSSLAALLLFSLLIAGASRASAAETAPAYCMAVRGNGESIATHWNPMARMIEDFGMPKAAAGGSSGAISLYLLDSLAGNRQLARVGDEAKKRKMQALLMKSMPEFLKAMAAQDKLPTAVHLAQALKDPSSTLAQKLAKIREGGGGLTEQDLEHLKAKYGGVINPEILRGLTGSNALFYKKQVEEGMKMFGAFDATDPNLFFRPGVADFKYMALLAGTVGDFYAGNTDAATQAKLGQFMDTCAEGTYKKSLSDDCKARFQGIVKDYIGNKNIGDFANSSLFKPVGSNVSTYASTAVIKGPDAQRFIEKENDFKRGATGDYAGFSVSPANLGIGYYGNAEKLAHAGASVRAENPGDYKSEKFTPIGATNWFTVLSTSPAEPGLASFQRIPINTDRATILREAAKPYSSRWSGLQYRPDMISAGGWSDLQPTLVLKAQGCHNIAYVTREGGETKFGQQVFGRLVGEDKPGNPCQVPFLKDLATAADADRLNDEGRDVRGTTAECSGWNKMWNRGNPDSSTNRSLGAADIVFCTNWNAFSIAGGQEDLAVADSMDAPVIVSSSAPAAFKHLTEGQTRDPNKPGCVPKAALGQTRTSPVVR